MGSIVFRNRYWFYKSLYDDYLGRDFKLSFGISCLLWMPHYWMGISINRAVEEGSAHKNYFVEYHPRRNRLTHSLIFEEFEMVVEDWNKLEREYLVSKLFEMQMERGQPRSPSYDLQSNNNPYSLKVQSSQSYKQS